MQWTNKLASVVDEEQGQPKERDINTKANFDPSRPSVQTALRLEGPYFTFANPSAYRTVICLVAGTGLSGALAIAAAFVAQNDRMDNDKSTKTKIPASIGPEHLDGPSCGTDEALRLAPRWNRCVVVWSIRESQYVDMPFFHGKSALKQAILVSPSKGHN